ncbi:MAG: N-6 DNA methylase [Clostridia bacterium]|nr:N-6 DNA methylase [Clostridia bacterium]
MANAKKEKSMESILWDACDKLRGAVEPAEYKHVILSLIFLKYANDRFTMQREKLLSEGKPEFMLNEVSFYEQDNVFFIPECARWDYLMSQSKQDGLAIKVDTALHEIELKNKSLAGALPDNYYSRLELENNDLASLLDKMNQLKFDVHDKDFFGRVYEYFLSKFALKEGKGKGEFYTPQTVVALLCELIEPYSGAVYDGACGSGGMFVQSMKFIEQHSGDKKNISVFGQEKTATTLKLAKMNLAIRGISADLGKKATSTFQNDQHPDLKADYALMNPPFNQKDWREENELIDDARWKGYKVPPTSNANYAWILNFVSKLSTNGVGCLLLANGALSADGTEYEIRKQLIENDLIEAIIVLPRNMFYTTDISVTVWVFNKNKKARKVNKNGNEFCYRDRTDEILFMDLRQMGEPFEKKYTAFSTDDINKVASTYHLWQSSDKEKLYSDIKEYCASVNKENLSDYSLVTSKYIEFDKKSEETNYEEEMKSIQNNLKELFIEEEKSKDEIKKIMEELGYGI